MANNDAQFRNRLDNEQRTYFDKDGVTFVRTVSYTTGASTTSKAPISVDSLTYDDDNRPISVTYTLADDTTETVTLTYTDKGYLEYNGITWRDHKFDIFTATIVAAPYEETVAGRNLLAARHNTLLSSLETINKQLRKMNHYLDSMSDIHYADGDEG